MISLAPETISIERSLLTAWWAKHDPFPSYQRLRAKAPVFYDETIGYWIVSQYADIKAVFEDWRNFSSEKRAGANAPVVRGGEAGAEAGELYRLFRSLRAGAPGPYSHPQGRIQCLYAAPLPCSGTFGAAKGLVENLRQNRVIP